MAYLQSRNGRHNLYARKFPGAPPHYVGSYGTLAEALANKAHVERTVEKKPEKVEKMPSDTALDEFEASIKRRPDTVAFYMSLLRPFAAWMGKKPLATWTAQDVDAYLKTREGAADEGWSPRRVQAFIRACTRFIERMRDRKVACADFVAGVEIPEQDPQERPARTPAEADAVLARAQLEVEAGRKGAVAMLKAVALARYAGLSLADIYAVTNEEVDLKAGVLRRRRHKTRVGAVLFIAPPLAAILKAHPGPALARVCEGLPKHPTTAIHRLHDLEVRAGVEASWGDGYHSYRRTFATMVATAPGATVADVGAALQHKPGSTATLRYVKADPTRVRNAVLHAARAGGS